MGILDTVHVGASGLAAASASIDATAQNVTNSLTPGFTRRSADLSVNDPLRQGLVHIGQGVSVDAITRDAQGLLGMQRVEASGDASLSAALHDALAEVEPLFNETFSSGPRSQLSAFFDALTAASPDPSDDGGRSEVVYAASGLADAMARTAEGLAQAQADLAEQIEVSLPPLSAKLQEVAVLNRQLDSAGGAASAPDLADQLDRLLRELGEEAGFTARIEANGTATVMLGGHAVVSGGEAREVSLSPPTAIAVAVDSGHVTVPPGGRLGGLAEAHTTVGGYIDQLDGIAVALADSVNGALAGGFDPSGNPGAPLFTYQPHDPAGSLAVVDGFGGSDLAFAGTSAAAAGDGTNLDALLALEGTALVADQTLGDALSSLTNTVSLDVSAAANAAEADRLILSDLDTLASNLHGVDLDEEAASLITFQTAYQASARVVSVANDLLGTLLEIA